MVKLVFQSTERSQVRTELTTQRNSFGEIYIEISKEGMQPHHICLDRKSAIKLVKVLKVEIGKAKEVSNG